MTTYEVLTLSISSLALVIAVGIPIFSYIFKKYIMKLKIEEYHDDKVFILFNHFGSNLRLKLVLDVENKPMVINKIETVVKRVRNNEELKLSWLDFMPLE